MPTNTARWIVFIELGIFTVLGFFTGACSHATYSCEGLARPSTPTNEPYYFDFCNPEGICCSNSYLGKHTSMKCTPFKPLEVNPISKQAAYFIAYFDTDHRVIQKATEYYYDIAVAEYTFAYDDRCLCVRSEYWDLKKILSMSEFTYDPRGRLIQRKEFRNDPNSLKPNQTMIYATDTYQYSMDGRVLTYIRQEDLSSNMIYTTEVHYAYLATGELASETTFVTMKISIMAPLSDELIQDLEDFFKADPARYKSMEKIPVSDKETCFRLVLDQTYREQLSDLIVDFLHNHSEFPYLQMVEKSPKYLIFQ